MRQVGGSIRNKILAVLALGIALVVAGALYGFAAARSGLATVARVNDTLIAQSIDTQALEGAFKEQVTQWMSAIVRGHDADSLERSWKQFTYREREVRRGAEKLRDAVELPAARELLGKFLTAHKEMGDRYRAAVESFKTGGGVKQSEYPEYFWNGLRRFTAGWHENHLVQEWIPVVPEIKSRLEAGCRYADVGCGQGLAVVRLAQAFPQSHRTPRRRAGG